MSDDLIFFRKVDKDEADRIREEMVHWFLTWVVSGLKGHLDLSRQRNINLLEMEAFTTALMTGGAHPALQAWHGTR